MEFEKKHMCNTYTKVCERRCFLDVSSLSSLMNSQASFFGPSSAFFSFSAALTLFN